MRLGQNFHFIWFLFLAHFCYIFALRVCNNFSYSGKYFSVILMVKLSSFGDVITRSENTGLDLVPRPFARKPYRMTSIIVGPSVQWKYTPSSADHVISLIRMKLSRCSASKMYRNSRKRASRWSTASLVSPVTWDGVCLPTFAYREL